MTTDVRRFAAIELVERFWSEVWSQPDSMAGLHQLAAPDLEWVCGGETSNGVRAVAESVAAWSASFGSQSIIEEAFASADASRVTTRFICPASDEEGCVMAGIAIWSIQWDRRVPRVSAVWLERSVREAQVAAQARSA